MDPPRTASPGKPLLLKLPRAADSGAAPLLVLHPRGLDLPPRPGSDGSFHSRCDNSVIHSWTGLTSAGPPRGQGSDQIWRHHPPLLGLGSSPGVTCRRCRGRGFQRTGLRPVLACLKWTNTGAGVGDRAGIEPGPPEAAGPGRLAHLCPLEARVLRRGFEPRGDTRPFVLGCPPHSRRRNF